MMQYNGYLNIFKKYGIDNGEKDMIEPDEALEYIEEEESDDYIPGII